MFFFAFLGLEIGLRYCLKIIKANTSESSIILTHKCYSSCFQGQRTVYGTVSIEIQYLQKYWQQRFLRVYHTREFKIIAFTGFVTVLRDCFYYKYNTSKKVLVKKRFFTRISYMKIQNNQKIQYHSFLSKKCPHYRSS